VCYYSEELQYIAVFCTGQLLSKEEIDSVYLVLKKSCVKKDVFMLVSELNANLGDRHETLDLEQENKGNGICKQIPKTVVDTICIRMKHHKVTR
jgi:hypothetical protein